MVAQSKSSATPGEKIVHCAQAWRHTEKQVIGATPAEKPEANRKHFRAKQDLREACDQAENTGGHP